MYFILTAYGQNLVEQNPSSPPVCTSYTLGAAFNYTPNSAQTALQGATLYTGVPSAPVVESSALVRYVIALDNGIGDFNFGEAGLWDGSNLVAVGASSTLIAKTAQDTNVEGNNIVIDAYVATIGATYDIYTELTNSASPHQVPRISTVEALPVPNGSSSNLYIAASPSADSGSVLATAYEGRWSVSNYEFEAASGFVTAASGATISFATYENQIGDIELTSLGEYLLQMVTGPRAGLVRIVNVLPQSGPATLVLNTGFLPPPDVGDKFVLLRRGGNSIGGGSGGSGTYQGALLNLQGNLIPAGTTVMTASEAAAAIDQATNSIPASRLTGLPTQMAVQASGNNLFEAVTDVFGVPVGRVLPT